MRPSAIFGKLCLGIGGADDGVDWLRAALAPHRDLWVCPLDTNDYLYRRVLGAPKPGERHRMRRLCEGSALACDPATRTPEDLRRALDGGALYLADPVDDAWYAGLLTLGREQAYACDFSGQGALLTAQNWRRIEAECDTLRVIFIMRDPLARSWHRLHAQHAGTEGGTVAPVWPDALHDPAGEYGATLAALQDGLKARSWRVIFYEDVEEDPAFTLRGIEKFLNIDPMPHPNVAKIAAQGPSLPDPDDVPPDIAADMARIRRDVEAAGFSPPDCWTF